MTSLPKGFFDDDSRYIAVEGGVSLVEQEKLLEKNLKQEMKGFFKEINDSDIADLAAKEEEDELLEKEVEEEGVQLAYMAKLAVLMQRAGKKKRKPGDSSSSSNSDAIKEQADKLIASVASGGGDADSDGGSVYSPKGGSDGKIYSDVVRILEKRAVKKRRAGDLTT